jgi:hypothetical protein
MDAMNYDNYRQTTTHNHKTKKHIVIIEAKYSNTN